nr:hypothetical protein CIT39_05685 [Bradyrhizobium symbiodeficiens]
MVSSDEFLGMRLAVSSPVRARGAIHTLVIPGARDSAKPESIGAAESVDEWIPGPMLRIAPE